MVRDPPASVTGAVAEELRPVVAAGDLTGVVTIILQDGGVVDASWVGWRDVPGGDPVRRDTIFRIASMTKPITSTVALMLHEEGRFVLDDPVTDWAPELRGMRVLVSNTSSAALSVSIQSTQVSSGQELESELSLQMIDP